jgi:ADP-ribosylglycohydrolase
VCTAERAAYRNLAMMIPPPGPDGSVDGPFSSATWCNPYREWIGAQIRADFFGWAAPGRPERAAEWAWRDACISHIKNGIYGEMWVAAMLAAAWTTEDLEAIIRAGLGEIPARSRLAAEIEKVLGWRRDGWTFDQAIDRIHADWDESRHHDWCHTISNAAIVAVGLLWGDLDFEKSVCRAVTCAFDTDCNGATVGSIIGLILGAKRMPAKWTEPIRDTLQTGIHGMHEIRLSDAAKQSCELVAKL